jgi:predicted ATPase
VDLEGRPACGRHAGRRHCQSRRLASLRHVLAFRSEQQIFRIEDERIENEYSYTAQTEPYFYYHYQQGRPVINTREKGQRNLRRETVQPDLSILAQLRDPESYPEITYLAGIYERVRLYREWAFGRNTVFREPQKADLRNDRLEEDFSNLGLFLNRLRRQSKVKAALLSGLRDLYEGLTDFDISIEGGTVQVFFTEGDFTIPATRLSDGSVRYLCLLAILCDPEPPPLIGLEEPELGLHPDLLPNVADLLVAAAQRTQLIVTTHSDILVDALTERPDALVICEKHEGRTTMGTWPRTTCSPGWRSTGLGSCGREGSWEGSAGEQHHLPGGRGRFARFADPLPRGLSQTAGAVRLHGSYAKAGVVRWARLGSVSDGPTSRKRKRRIAGSVAYASGSLVNQSVAYDSGRPTATRSSAYWS